MIDFNIHSPVNHLMGVSILPMTRKVIQVPFFSHQFLTVVQVFHVITTVPVQVGKVATTAHAL